MLSHATVNLWTIVCQIVTVKISNVIEGLPYARPCPKGSHILTDLILIWRWGEDQDSPHCIDKKTEARITCPRSLPDERTFTNVLSTQIKAAVEYTGCCCHSELWWHVAHPGRVKLTGHHSDSCIHPTGHYSLADMIICWENLLWHHKYSSLAHSRKCSYWTGDENSSSFPLQLLQLASLTVFL